MLMQEYGLSKASVYRYLKETEPLVPTQLAQTG